MAGKIMLTHRTSTQPKPSGMSAARSKLYVIAIVLSIALTVIVRTQFGDETFFCDGVECTLGSGTRWVLTGLSIGGPFLAVTGYLWSMWLDDRDQLGPAAKWSIPDAEQIFEVLSVLGAGLITYWLLLNGPSIEAVEVRQVNQLAASLREFRLEAGEPVTNLVPSRLTWFVIGAILSGPFWFSFGSMIGRELYGRRYSSLDSSSQQPAHVEEDFDF